MSSIGRDLRADVRIAHPLISRAHVLLRFDQGRWVAIDNGSLNGLFVNGRRVPAVDINDGLAVNIGNPDGPLLRFEVGHATGVGRAAAADDVRPGHGPHHRCTRPRPAARPPDSWPPAAAHLATAAGVPQRAAAVPQPPYPASGPTAPPAPPPPYQLLRRAAPASGRRTPRPATCPPRWGRPRSRRGPADPVTNLATSMLKILRPGNVRRSAAGLDQDRSRHRQRHRHPRRAGVPAPRHAGADGHRHRDRRQPQHQRHVRQRPARRRGHPARRRRRHDRQRRPRLRRRRR